MFTPANHLESLAARARKGDPTATAELRDEFEVQIVHMVRRTIRTGSGTSPLAQRILAEAHRIAPDGWSSRTDDDGMVRQVARRICETVMDRLGRRPADVWQSKDTVRN